MATKYSLLMRSCTKSKHKESEKRGCWGVEGQKRKLQGHYGSVAQPAWIMLLNMIKSGQHTYYFLCQVFIWKSDELWLPSIILYVTKIVNGKKEKWAPSRTLLFDTLRLIVQAVGFDIRYFSKASGMALWMAMTASLKYLNNYWMNCCKLWYEYSWFREDESSWLAGQFSKSVPGTQKKSMEAYRYIHIWQRVCASRVGQTVSNQPMSLRKKWNSLQALRLLVNCWH